MSDAIRVLDEFAAERLRDDFDRSFAEPRAPERPTGEDLLAIRIGPEPYALRLTEISGLFSERKVTRLPGGPPALLGIAAFRGAIVPVYDLAALLGHRPEETIRWLVVTAGEPIAFALARVDGHLRVDAAAIVQHESSGDERRHVRHFARTPELVRPILHLPSILDAVRRQATNIDREGR